mgnify:CR=1 FL=1|jgi:hypothetical protein
MSSGPPPVVDMKRYARIHPPEKPIFEWNMMNFCIIVMFMTFVGLWMRATEIRQKRSFARRKGEEPEPSGLP